MSDNLPPKGKKKAAKKSTSKAVEKATRQTKYDYENAKRQFIEGYPENPDNPDSDRSWPNLRELSDRTGIPYERIRERSAAERWMDQRTTHQRRIAEERMNKRVTELGKQSLAFDDRALDVAKIGMRLTQRALVEIWDGVKAKEDIRRIALQQLEAGDTNIDWKALGSFIQPDRLMTLARAAETFQSIGMRAMGTDVDKHVLQVAGEVDVRGAISVSEELGRDDPERLAAFIAALERAGAEQLLGEQDEEVDEDADDDVVDAVIVSDVEETEEEDEGAVFVERRSGWDV